MPLRFAVGAADSTVGVEGVAKALKSVLTKDAAHPRIAGR
jgi:hypothetical protein